MNDAVLVHSVSGLRRARTPLKQSSVKRAIEGLIHGEVEACSEDKGNLVAAPYHPLVAAVAAAFRDHRPLVLSPDMFWLLICQGFARHVNATSESSRSLLVNHDGKLRIAVRRDNFVKGSPDNRWSEVFAEFSAQIKQHIGEENHSSIVGSFSTTGAVERAANEIVLMDSLKSYFEYECRTLCGIPEVTLEGTAEDWNELHQRSQSLASMSNLDWWTSCIAPTLARIARNAAGADDPGLWSGIYKIEEMSGGPYINGWIVDFFPYLQSTRYVDKTSNEAVDDFQSYSARWDQLQKVQVETRNKLPCGDDEPGITTDALPGSLCSVPFLWEYLHRRYEMEFVAGFVGFTQDATNLAVRPKIGWAVREKSQVSRQ